MREETAEGGEALRVADTLCLGPAEFPASRYPEFLAGELETRAPAAETVAASINPAPLTLTFTTEDLHASERAAANVMTEYEKNFTAQGVKIRALEAYRPL